MDLRVSVDDENGSWDPILFARWLGSVERGEVDG
jgi:hypothetical protein